MMDLIFSLIGFGVLLVWIYLLFNLAKDHKGWFYFLFNVDLLPIVLVLLFISPIGLLLASIQSVALWLILALLFERVGKTIAFKSAADYDEVMWAYVIALVPILGWIIFFVIKSSD